MFDQAADAHPAVSVSLDQPLGCAPDAPQATVGDLATLVADLASRLWAIGIRPAERVAIYKQNNFDIALLACAAARIGAVPALLAPALPGDIATELIRRLDRPWLLTDTETLAGPLAAQEPVVRGSVLVDDGPAVDDGAVRNEAVRNEAVRNGAVRNGAVRNAAVRNAAVDHPLRDQSGAPAPVVRLGGYAGSPPRDPVLLHPREPALITHSSGTTGIPKLVVHCAGALWHRLIPQLAIASPVRKRLKVAFCLTFVHSRFYHALGVFLRYGNPLVIASDSAPETVGPLLVRTRPGFIETHPNAFIDWEDLVDAPGQPLSSIKYYAATFDAIHPRTVARLLSASKHRRPLMLAFYGQSETGPVAGRWFTRRGAAQADGRCVGLTLPGFIRLRVVGADGRRVRPGEAGHLEVRSRGRALTYLGEDERFASQLRDGWWRLGDMGYRSRRGLLYLIDREVDQIASMPSNLQAEDILMGRLTELREIVIVAGPEGEPVPVVCTRDDGPLDRARWARAIDGLPDMAEPVELPFHQLPRTSTAKIQRSVLSRLVAERK
ncbi:long-chain acyl-CoA synthetase [Frankia sp. R43]|nr:long-chain acyl-CoA synthetase [Frankia sp. R43]